MTAMLPLFAVLLVAGCAWAQASTDAGAAVEALARGTDTQARMDAAKQLGASKDSRALEPLLAALRDPNRDVRWAAIEALGELGDKRAVTPLVQYLRRKEAYRWGKRLVANALGAIGDPSAVEALLGLLADDDPFARRAAALALLRIGEPRAASRIADLFKDPSDETLTTVGREFVRAREARSQVARGREPSEKAAAAAAKLGVREWAGLKVGVSTLAAVRQKLGAPLQETPDSLLFRGEQVGGPLRIESAVINAGPNGVIESIFVFPIWGTLDRDTRALLGPGKLLTYGEFLRLTGRTAYGAGTRAEGKLHYLQPDLLTESYPDLGILVVYDSADIAARDRLVKLLIVY